MTQRRALIVRGGWPGHDPVGATDLFRPFLEASGFTVRVEDSPAPYADTEAMAATDLVLQCISMGEITDEQVQGLRTAVANGTGLAGWHGGIADSFRASADYLQLVGGQFAAHPPREDARGNAVRYRVAMTDLGRNHPITTGIEDFELETEQYWVLSDTLNDVLATTTHAARPDQPWHRPVTVPAVWTRDWGAGRVFVATPGHDLDVLRDSAVRTIVERGLLWAARDEDAA
jgi:type 1 glutamine amidotransferase